MENFLSKKVKQEFNKLQNLSEELRLQMALGKAEARDLIEDERKQLSTYLKKQKERVSETGSEKASNEVVSSLENLDKKLFREIPVNAAGYDEYKNDILKNIYEVEEKLRNDSQNHDIAVQENLDAFKNKMDAYRVNLALHDTENPARVQNIKRDFTNRLEKVIAMLNDEKIKTEKLDNFSKDITESYNYLKKAISDLSSK